MQNLLVGGLVFLTAVSVQSAECGPDGVPAAVDELLERTGNYTATTYPCYYRGETPEASCVACGSHSNVSCPTNLSYIADCDAETNMNCQPGHASYPACLSECAAFCAIAPPASPSPPLPPSLPLSLPVPASIVLGLKPVNSLADIQLELQAQLLHGSPLYLELPGALYTLEGQELSLQGTNLTLVGSGPDGATLDAQNLSRVVRVVGSGHLRLQNIHLRNGLTANGGGGGLRLESSSTAILENCTIASCAATFGGGASIANGATLVVTDSDVSFCTATQNGGGLHAENSILALTNSAVTGCVATRANLARGGGCYAENSCTLTFTNSAVTSCVAAGRIIGAGGGLCVRFSSTLTLTHSTVTSCNVTASLWAGGAGLYAVDSCTLTVTSSAMTSCVAAADNAIGGGFNAVNSCILTLTSCTVASCVAAGETFSYGGGLYADDACILTLTNCEMTGCVATASTLAKGAGLFGADSCTFTLIDSAVTSCVARGDERVDGAGVYAEYDCILALANSAVTSCVATGGTWTAAGGGVLLYIRCTLTLTNSAVISCVATSPDAEGGGFVTIGFCIITLTNSVVSSCSCVATGGSSARGGGFHLQSSSTLTLINSVLTSCVATEGSEGALTEAGGLYLESGEVKFTNGSSVRNCTATVGKTLVIKAGTITYVFPTLAGYWLPQVECRVYRESCPTGTPAAEEQCRAQRDACSQLPDDIDGSAPSGCAPSAAVQPCPWKSDESLLLKPIYLVPNEPLNEDLPFACVPGYVGSPSQLEQRSPFCAGPCPGGAFCPTDATTTPIVCPAGSFCPLGTSVPRSCPSATFSNETGLESSQECAPCPVGHACAAGATAPTPCEAGSYADKPSTTCTLVPAGQYQDQLGQEKYLPCPPGFACPEGSRTPVACDAGTFSNRINLATTSDCVTAPAGSFAAAGSSVSSFCLAGRFGSTNGFSDGQCEGACAAGHFCPEGSTNATARVCPAGTYNPFNGGQSIEVCTPCPAGLFSATPGSIVCDECEAGSISPVTGMSQCVPCKEGQYQPLKGMSECRVCAAGAWSAEGAVDCAICDTGFVKNTTSDLGDQCTDCADIEGVTCPRDTILANLKVKKGFWRHSENTRVIYACRSGDAGWTPCAGGRDAGDDGDGYCASGYEGPVCEECTEENAYFKQSSARCIDCGAVLANVAILVTIAVFSVGVVIAAVSIVRSSWQPRSAVVARALAHARRFVQVWEQLGMQCKLKQAIGLYQVIAAIPTVFNVTLPDEDYATWVYALSWPSFIDNVFLPGECYSGGYFALLLSSTLWPVGLILAAMLASVSWDCARKLLNLQQYSSWREVVERGLHRALPFALFLTFLCIISISTRIFKTFLCDAFVFDDGSAENDYSQTYRTYLHDDYSLECSTGEYARSRDWAYALIALWPVGVPLLYSTVLAASRKADTARGPSKLSRAVGFLHRDYKPRFFWWEPIELVRKLCLTGVPLLIDTTAELARVVVALLVTLLALAVHASVQPFKRSIDNKLSACIQFGLTLIYLTVLLIKVCEESDETCKTLGLGSSSGGVFLLFAIFTTSLLLGLLIIGGAQDIRTRSCSALLCHKLASQIAGRRRLISTLGLASFFCLLPMPARSNWID